MRVSHGIAVFAAAALGLKPARRASKRRGLQAGLQLDAEVNALFEMSVSLVEYASINSGCHRLWHEALRFSSVGYSTSWFKLRWLRVPWQGVSPPVSCCRQLTLGCFPHSRYLQLGCLPSYSQSSLHGLRLTFRRVNLAVQAALPPDQLHWISAVTNSISIDR